MRQSSQGFKEETSFVSRSYSLAFEMRPRGIPGSSQRAQRGFQWAFQGVVSEDFMSFLTLVVHLGHYDPERHVKRPLHRCGERQLIHEEG